MDIENTSTNVNVDNSTIEEIDDEIAKVEESPAENIFDKIQSRIDSLPEDKQGQIHLLKIKFVILWIFGITTFLEPENPIVSYGTKDIKVENGFYKNGKPKYKKEKVDDKDKPKYKYNKGQLLDKMRENEAEWNMDIMKEIRPDLFKKDHSQASLFGLFGEILVKEYYIMTGEYKTDKPEKKGGHDLDLETIGKMIEVKTGSYFTTGTAGEKIFGIFYKYAAVPRLYNKPLLVVLLGGDKKESDLVCKSEIPEREDQKEYWKSKNMTYTCFKKLLNSL